MLDNAGVLPVIVASEKVVLIVPGKHGVGVRVVLVPADVNSRRKVRAVELRGRDRPRREVALAVIGDELRARGIDDLVVSSTWTATLEKLSIEVGTGVRLIMRNEAEKYDLPGYSVTPTAHSMRSRSSNSPIHTVFEPSGFSSTLYCIGRKLVARW